MGDWNTLHIFNDRYFYEHLVADFKDKGTKFKSHMDSLLGKYILSDNSNSEERTRRLVEFSRQYRPDFKIHETFYELLRKEKELDELHFKRIHYDVIEDLHQLLPLIIFSECAAFNPHLKLGRTIFTGNVHAKPRSIAQEIIEDITNNIWGIMYHSSMGLMNWITYEELQLLWLDKDKLQVAPGGNERYLQEFIAFMELALQHECGFISVTNVNEQVLCMIKEAGLKINVDPKERGWESVITFPGS